MPRGPLPNPQRRRRNAPTIPTTELPAGGRTGRVPKVPEWIILGAAGEAFWRWVWHTPQAAAWADGVEVTVARRARIEDDLLAARPMQLATLMGRALELDRQLGLTPKAMADLRWSIAPDELAEKRDDAVTARRLKAVDVAVAQAN